MTYEFDGKRAYAHLEKLTHVIGSRLSGTHGEELAAEYVRETLQSYGLETRTLEFEAPLDELQDFHMEVVDPPLGEVTCRPVVGGADTPDEGITAEIIFLEKLNEAGVGPELEGKIIVLPERNFPTEDLRPILKYHPAAVVFASATLNPHPITFHSVHRGEEKPFDPIPRFCISYAEALRWWKDGVKKVRITLKTQHSKGTSRDVIAELTGSQFPDDIIVIGGHMDSVPDIQGAMDNAAGTATMLELARVFAQQGCKRTLRFIAWGTEEGGDLGSAKYVIELKKKDRQERADPDFVEGYSRTELERHIFQINLDVLGLALGSTSCSPLGPAEIGSYIHSLACELGIALKVNQEPYESDNLTFCVVGIPSWSFVREGAAWDYMHSFGDTLDLMDPVQLEKVGKLVEIALRRTANGHIWPFKREVPAEVVAGLIPRARPLLGLWNEDPTLFG
jgi:aminopeptidase YwaD